MRFRNRQEAGRLLSERLLSYQQRDVVVLAIPRGGVVVGYEVATNLGQPLDVLLPRKIGAPGQPEWAIGAVIEADGTYVAMNEDAVRRLGIDQAWLDRQIEREKAEIARRARLYRGDRPFPSLLHRTAIVVDDGIATGYTMRAAIEALRRLDTSQVVVAVPVASEDAWQIMFELADLAVCLQVEADFTSVGEWYEEFPQVTDEEVIELLSRAAAVPSTPSPPGRG